MNETKVWLGLRSRRAVGVAGVSGRAWESYKPEATGLLEDEDDDEYEDETEPLPG